MGRRGGRWGRVVVLAVVAGLALGVRASVASFVGQCHRICSDEVAACVAAGQRRTRCIRQILGRCRHEGPQVCGGAVTAAAPQQLIPPDGVTARATARRTVVVGWRDTNAREAGYLVERSRGATTGFVAVATLAPDLVAYSDRGLADATTYYYRLR